MSPIRTPLALSGVLAFGLALPSAAQEPIACEQIAAALTLSQTVLSKAEPLAAGFLPPENEFSRFLPARPVAAPFCRVAGRIEPSIQFEVWLPANAAWNGRLQGIGNGGMAGAINYLSLQSALEAGYAAVASDLGHQSGTVEGHWAIGRPELVRDWGHRATHEMTVKAKAIVRAHYGRPASYAYFSGCSGGGRQGLMEAQRYPEDYDGILAGNPTMDFTRLVAGGRLWQTRVNLDRETGQNLLTPGDVELIHAAVLEQCDALDGVADGVLDDPRECRFDTAPLLCATDRREGCLTLAQISVLEALYRGSTDGAGRQVYPGYPPGGELGRFGWSGYFATPEPAEAMQWIYAKGFLQGLVFEDADYDPGGFDYDRDVAPMDAKPVLDETLARAINATDPDLRAFRERGGRLIHYHGWSDPGVSALRSIAYYEEVRRALAPPAAAGAARPQRSEVDDFYRLFLVPGLQHCFGGPGANVFGASPFGPPSPDPDPERDAFAALERWVEQGVAPERIVATKFKDDDPRQGTLFTRPLCPYPQRAVYRGEGDTSQAESFRCEGGN